MKHALKALGIAAGAALALTACSPGTTGDQSETIVVAHVADFSGDYSFYDAPIADGLKLAAQEINDAGGILGKQVEILTIDTHNNQADAIRGVEDAIDADAIYIVGTTSPGDWQAQATVACEAGLLISTGDGTSGTLVPSASGDCAYHVIMTNAAQAAVSAEHALSEGLTKAYVLGSKDDTYHLELPGHFMDAFEHGGGTVVGYDDFRMGAGDFNVHVTKIASLKPQPDLIYTSMYAPDTPQFLRQLRAAGVETPVYSADGSVDSSILDVGAAAEGLIATFHAWPSSNNTIAEFIKNFDANADASESPEYIVSALGYDELKMIEKVINDQGEATSEALKEGFKSLSFEGITGALTMNPETRQAKKEVALVKVVDGKYEYVDSFVPSYTPAN